jgi:hypothetical protein
VNPRLLDLGDGALTLEFGDRIDPALNARVMAARDALAALKLEGISDLVPTYRSLTVHFDPLQLDRETLGKALLQAAASPDQKSAPATRWLIPVAFGGEFGPDLAQVAQTTGRSESDVIDAVCAAELRVFLIGFPARLPLSRRTARLAAPAAPQHAAHRRPRQQPGHRRAPGRNLSLAKPGRLAPVGTHTGKTVRRGRHRTPGIAGARRQRALQGRRARRIRNAGT